ncbi:hypothetical protein HYT23_03280 [Candidatus Pacearchaeota archaeon]|nr:hypothetical protein [Candidatus Pacearchaeota archaeon]
MIERKERRYKILETIMLDFNTVNAQYSALYSPEDNAQVIVYGSDVYLFYEEKNDLPSTAQM